jgi:hypothetical protein
MLAGDRAVIRQIPAGEWANECSCRGCMLCYIILFLKIFNVKTSELILSLAS